MKKLDKKIDYINRREWCITDGYDDDPTEYLMSSLTQCKDKFAVLVMAGPVSKKQEDEKQLQKMLGSFKCLN
ncbi:MAG: hypothetical protein Q7S22_00925 [Candidatus Micrarchaeota archaeon]|nr:hypothetical protein [Candidatus Micrarchaeota archaeon]